MGGSFSLSIVPENYKILQKSSDRTFWRVDDFGVNVLEMEESLDATTGSYLVYHDDVLFKKTGESAKFVHFMCVHPDCILSGTVKKSEPEFFEPKTDADHIHEATVAPGEIFLDF